MKTVLNTLHQNSHMHFDFTTLKSVKFTPVMEKYRERGEQESKDKRVEEERLTSFYGR